MSALERKVVHEHLKARHDVETYSEGQEPTAGWSSRRSSTDGGCAAAFHVFLDGETAAPCGTTSSVASTL